MATVLTTSPVGRVLGLAFNNWMPNRGVTIDTSSDLVTNKTKAMLFFRLYEDAEIRFVRRHMRGASNVVELGASIGVTSRHLVDVMASGGKLTCVEANDALLPALRSNSEASRGRVTVRVVHSLIGTTPGAGLLIEGTTTYTSRAGAHGRAVPQITLGDVVGSDEPFALVSDIEGGEASFILDDPSALGRCHSGVLELHDSPQGSVEDMISALVQVGFDIVEQRGPVVAIRRREVRGDDAA